MNYGQAPELCGTYDIDVQEMFFYMYLPIKMKGEYPLIYPKRLEIFKPLIYAAVMHETPEKLVDKYIYITAKNIFVTKDNPGNRPGWHSDGFGTNDINYIWCDKFPTVFSIQEFALSSDCEISMRQMESQANNETTYPEKTLLRLTESQIHKSPDILEPGMRCFVKISISDHKYNLAGNSHNHLINYKWKMHDRSKVRNHPYFMESDFFEPK